MLKFQLFEMIKHFSLINIHELKIIVYIFLNIYLVILLLWLCVGIQAQQCF